MKPTLAAGAAVLLLACGGVGTTTTASVTTTTTGTSAAPTTTTSALLDSRQIYQTVSPSLAYVDGDLGTGSGIVIDERYVLTNLHVIWPGSTATVTLTNGVVVEDAPIVAIDWMADLAVIEVESSDALPAPAELANAVDLPIGSEVYLVGYPADSTRDPVPAITAGVLSRVRMWPNADLEFIQSDASISGGQSGGALVSETGEVIGLSGLSIGDGGLALSLSSPDVVKLVEQMLSGEDRWNLGSRVLGDLVGETVNSTVIPNFLAEAVFTFDGEAGDPHTFNISADHPSSAYVTAADGFLEGSLEDTDDGDQIEVELGIDGTFFLSVIPIIDYDVTVDISTDVQLRLMSDPDHAVDLSAGMTYFGNADYPGDWDWFGMELQEGDEITILVTTAAMDPGIAVDWVGNSGDEFVAIDSDSAGGVLGYDAEVTFTAPVTGSYIISITDESSYGPGGYILEVS